MEGLRIPVLLAFLLVLLLTPVSARILSVGSGGYASIGLAVKDAVAGDLIRIQAGTYSESVDLGSMKTPGSLTLVPAGAAGSVTISGPGRKIYSTVALPGTVVLEGLQIVSSDSGAVQIDGANALVLAGCTLRSGATSGTYHGVSLSRSSGTGLLVLEGCTFSSRSGDALHVEVSGSGTLDLDVEGGAVDLGRGGAFVRATGGTVRGTVTGVAFRDLSSRALLVRAEGTSSVSFFARNNTLSNATPPLKVGRDACFLFVARGAAQMDLEVTGNTLTSVGYGHGLGLRLLTAGSGTPGVTARICQNTLSGNGSGALGRGIWIDNAPGAGKAGTMNLLVRDNDITGFAGEGILLRGLDSSTTDACISGNEITQAAGGIGGISVMASTASGGAGLVRTRIDQNLPGTAGISLTQSTCGLQLDRATNTTATGAEDLLKALNPLPVGTVTVTITGTPSIIPAVTTYPSTRIAPVANADSASAASGNAASFSPLANDTGSALALIGFSGVSAAGGAVTCSGSTLTCTPLAGFSGTDTLWYTLRDDKGEAASAKATLSFVALPSTTTTLSASPSPAGFGQTVKLTAPVAVVPPATGKPAGEVTFLDGTTVLGTAAIDRGGKAQLAVSSLSTGTHSLTARYEGNASFLTSTSSAVSLEIRMVIVPPSSPAALQGFPASRAFTQSGGTTPVTYSIVTGTLPAGLTLQASGALSGTPSASGSFPVTVRASDSAGHVTTLDTTLLVKPATADLDGNGVVDSLDLQVEAQILAGDLALPEGGGADVNQDGMVNVGDLLEILLVQVGALPPH